MINTFYFILKAFFRSYELNFCLDFFGHAENNGLVRKKMLISKFIASQPGWQTIAVHILPNVSRSNDKQVMKFSQFIE